MTPVKEDLANIHNCGLFVTYAGAVMFCMQRCEGVFSQAVNQDLCAAIIAAQYDWRYFKRVPQSLTFLDGIEDKGEAIRRTIPHFFMEKMKSKITHPYPQVGLFEAVAFVLELTRHLLGERHAPCVR